MLQSVARLPLTSVFDVRRWGASTSSAGAQNTAAIQAAIDDAPAGATVMIPDGDWVLGSQVVATNVRLRGQSRDGTRLVRGYVAANDAEAHNALIRTSGTGIVSDLTIDGQYSTFLNTGGNSRVELFIDDFGLAERLRIEDFSFFGVDMSGSDYPVLRDSVIVGNALGDTGTQRGDGYVGVLMFGATGIGALVSRVHVSDCHANGMQMGGVGSRILDCTLVDNHRMATIIRGGQIDVIGTDPLIRGCFIDGANAGSQTIGIEVAAVSSGAAIEGNRITSHGGPGIYIAGPRTSVTAGNIIANNGRLSADGTMWHAGIQVDGPSGASSGWKITGNTIYDDQTPKTQTYGIYVMAGAYDDYIITDNDLRGNLTGAISNGATGVNKVLDDNLPLSANDPAATKASALGLGATDLPTFAGVHLSGTIATTQLTANTNNWNPAGLATAAQVLILSDAARDLTGIVAQSSGRVIFLSNSGAFTITLKSDSSSSTAGNRLTTPGATDFALTTGRTVILRYSTVTLHWHVVA